MDDAVPSPFSTISSSTDLPSIMQANITTEIAITEGIGLLAMTPCGKTQTLLHIQERNTSTTLHSQTALCCYPMTV